MSLARGEGRGGAKVILLGEHAVVYGQPAIVAGLPLGATAIVGPPSEPGSWRLSFGLAKQAGEAARRAAGPQELDALRAVAAELKVATAVSAQVDFEVPPGVGLGASAAAGVAIGRALANWRGGPSSDEFVFRATQRWESVFHGNASGVDAAAATFGGLLHFEKDREPFAVPVPAPLDLVIGVAAPPCSTRTMVERVAELSRRDTATHRALIHEIGKLVTEAESALGGRDWARLGALMNENQHALERLGVSTETLERACRVARDAGAWGAKLTGAGGGGCVVAAVPCNEVPRVVRAFERADVGCYTTRVAPSH